MNDEALRILEFDRVREILAGYAASKPGGDLARTLRPAVDEAAVRALLLETGETLRLRREGHDLPFGGVHEVTRALAEVRERGRPLDAESFARLGETLAAATEMRDRLRRLPAEDYPVLRSRAEGIEDHEILRERIAAVIGSRGEILDDASGRLQRLRSEITEAEARIGTRVQQLV